MLNIPYYVLSSLALPLPRFLRDGVYDQVGAGPALPRRPLTASLRTQVAKHRGRGAEPGRGAAQVASNRYALFGKSDTLRMSDADQSTRFL